MVIQASRCLTPAVSMGVEVAWVLHPVRSGMGRSMGPPTAVFMGLLPLGHLKCSATITKDMGSVVSCEETKNEGFA